MTWIEFANKLNAKFEKKSNPFLGGEKVCNKIEKEYADKAVRIQKEIIKSYGSSSHSNFEKLEIDFSFKDIDFGKSRIIRKNYLTRIGKSTELQYKIEGANSAFLKATLASDELKYLLQHPKSEFILLKNSLIFKAQSQGEMNENLERILRAIKLLKNEILRNL